MAGDTSRLIRQLYAGALQRDPEERAEYLDRACAGRSDLRAKVVALLDAHSRDFLEAPDTGLAPTGYADASQEQSDERVVGPYIIRRELGRGGMGVVYLADDTRRSQCKGRGIRSTCRRWSAADLLTASATHRRVERS